MLDERIEALTTELEQVRLDQDQLRTRERRIVEELIDTLKEARGANATRADTPIPEGNEKQQKPAKEKQDKFNVGDRVRIKNPKPRRPGTELTEEDRTGTISRKSKYFIFVHTDNYLNVKEIRRSRSNLEHLK